MAKSSQGLHLVFEPFGAACQLIGDPERLKQVWNLLSNTVKFTSPGGEICIDLRRRDSALELVVRDSGLGIEPEFLPRLV